MIIVRSSVLGLELTTLVSTVKYLPFEIFIHSIWVYRVFSFRTFRIAFFGVFFFVNIIRPFIF